jgi:predicted type IV restriction endonuclease
MELHDSLLQLAARIPSQIEHLKTEEATKAALVMPFINSLGYNVFDPTEVIPEFVADVGVKKGEKVDYVLMHSGKPAILVECKHIGAPLTLENASQLFRYFTVTEARFAILTNGVDYRIYSDLESPNKMDSKPFFEFNMLNLDARIVSEIKKFSKATFNIDEILSNATELKYMKQIREVLESEIKSPTEDLVKLLTARVYSGRITGTITAQFTKLVHTALNEMIRDKINDRLKSAIDGTYVPTEPMPSGQDEEDAIETTPEEFEGYHIVKAILSKTTEPSRVVMRDTKSYCGVLLDDNNRKPICRLRFNYSQKYIGLFDASKNEEKFSISSVAEIYKYESRLLDTVANYDGAPDTTKQLGDIIDWATEKQQRDPIDDE